MYTVRGRTAATVATAGHAICQLWNPHATQRIKVLQFGIFKQAAGTAGDALRAQRSNARGTAGSTVTPDIDNHSEQAAAPVSGALLDLAAFTGQPTLETPDLGPGWVAPAIAGGGLVYPFPGGVVIPAGKGLVITQVAASIWPISDITFVWLEDW